MLVLGGLGIGAGVAFVLRRLQRVEVTGNSMLPTLQPGDRLVVLRTQTVARGRLAAVHDPRQPSRVVIKRVAATSASGVTVLGDNPPASTDSRTFGAVPWSHVRGWALYRYFPPSRRGRLPRRAGTVGLVLQEELDRVLASDFLGDLSSRPLEEIRSLRAECQGAEAKLSYMRRLVQGRLDILVRELRQRGEGRDPSDAGALVEDLPDILADNVHSARHERLVTTLHPPDIDEVTAEIDAKAGTGALGSFSELSNDDLAALKERLTAVDREVSDQRKAVFGRIDSLSAELTRRYKDGEASVETALS